MSKIWSETFQYFYSIGVESIRILKIPRLEVNVNILTFFFICVVFLKLPFSFLVNKLFIKYIYNL